ncbi:MAG: insulinase family protein [Candidatus Cloacimonetes bacterium]|nr:insulinase family protein [Candidatus Cloacimonadota bacterium]
MKKAIALALFLSLLCMVFGAEILQKTLSNGLTVVIKQNTQNPTVGIYCFVKTGSMHEGKHLGSGLSHYVEHVVSGGTTSLRKEKEYTDLNKLMGASTNAYTSLDRTAYLSVAGKEHFAASLKTISEFVQHCQFDSSEVAREQQVISKEIILAMAQPLSKLFLRKSEAAEPTSNSSLPVIGRPELFLQLKRQDLIDYYKARYVPNNMVLVIVGDIDPKLAMEEVENNFGGFSRGNLEPIYQPSQAITLGKREVVEEFEILQPWVLISQQIPNSNPQDVYLLDAATELLINKESCSIQKKLQQDLKLVRFIYASTDYNKVENSASFNITFEATRTEDIPRILDILYGEFAGDAKKSYFTDKMLQTLITKYERQKYLKSRAVDDECEEIGDSMLENGIADADQLWLDILSNMKVAEVDKAIKTYFNPNNKFTFYGLPIGDSVKLKSSSTAGFAKDELKKTDLGGKLTLIHKQNAEFPVVRGTVFVPVSSYYETADNIRIISFMINLLQKGSKKYSKDMWTDWLDEHSASLYCFNSDDGIYIMFTCLAGDLPQIQDMIVDAIKNPLFAEQEIALLKSDWEGNNKRTQSFAQIPHNDFVASKVYSSPREILNSMQENEVAQKFTRRDVINAYNKYLKAESMIVSIVGDRSETEAAAIAKNIFSAFDHGKVSDTIKLPVLRITNESYTQEFAFEHAFVDFTMSCPGIDDPDFIVMKVMDALLNYGDRRLHHATRVEKDLAYYAGAYNVSCPGYGLFRVSSQSSKEKIAELKQVLEQQIDRLINEPVTAKELNEAIENYLKQHQNYITDEWLGYYAIGFEVQGLGYDFFVSGASLLKKVDPKDIQRVANKYLRNRDVTISIPSDEVERIMPE